MQFRLALNSADGTGGTGLQTGPHMNQINVPGDLMGEIRLRNGRNDPVGTSRTPPTDRPLIYGAQTVCSLNAAGCACCRGNPFHVAIDLHLPMTARGTRLGSESAGCRDGTRRRPEIYDRTISRR